MAKILSKINHEWSILCSQSIVDRDVNNISLINLIERINLNIELKEGREFDEEKGDVFPLSMVVVSRFRKIVPEKEIVNCDVKIDFVSPDQKTLGSFKQEFELGKEIDNIRMRFGIEGLKLTKSGMYHFKVFLKEKEDKKFEEVYALPLNVTLNIS